MPADTSLERKAHKCAEALSYAPIDRMFLDDRALILAALKDAVEEEFPHYRAQNAEVFKVLKMLGIESAIVRKGMLFDEVQALNDHRGALVTENERLIAEESEARAQLATAGDEINLLRGQRITARDDALEEAAKEVRAKCGPCKGTGNGDEYHVGYTGECEYCGRPRDAIRALKSKHEGRGDPTVTVKAVYAGKRKPRPHESPWAEDDPAPPPAREHEKTMRFHCECGRRMEMTLRETAPTPQREEE